MEDKYIILYADEFKQYIWEEYMKILGLSKDARSVKITIKDVIVIS